MPENVRALIVIMGLSIPMLWFLRLQLTRHAIAPGDYNLRAGLWIALTITLFLAHNFWLFVLVVTIALLTVGRADTNPIGLYFFLLLLAPPFQSQIHGFGGINRFLAIDYLRLLSLVMLLPLSLRLWRDRECPRLFKLPADKYLLGYLVLQLVIQASVTTATDAMRSMMNLFIDVFLPYYAVSRGLYNREKLRDALASFAGACAVLAVIAVFESLKGWLLYSMLPSVLDVSWGFGSYMLRDGSLRATASLGHSIILGYVMTVALGLHLALRDAYASRKVWALVLIVLVAAIVASMSRGPWVGAAALVFVVLLLTPGLSSKFGKLAALLVLSIPVLMFTPMGAKILAVLPFIGNVDDASVDYRQQLFTVSWRVLMLNPIFGSPDYMSNPAMEQMRQGEGIIDMVNSYLGVAMFSGFAGLALFMCVFASSAVRLLLVLQRHSEKASESFRTGLALLATLVGVLVTIATVSSINAVPVVYWCLAGTCAAYLKFAEDEPALALRRSPSSAAAAAAT